MLNRNKKVETEKSVYSKIQEQLKQSAFEVVYQLLRLEEISMLFASILTIIEFIQMIYFQFSDINNSYWNSEKITDGIEDFFALSLIYPNLRLKSSSNTYIIVMYGAVLVIIIILLFLFYVSLFSKYKLPFSWPITVSKYLILFTQQILYVPFINLFANIFACTSVTTNGVSKTVLSDFQDMECWTGIHILHCFVAFVFICILTFLVMFLSQTYFDGRISSSDPTSKANGHINYTFSLYKLVIVVMFVFMSTSQFVYLILGIILGGSIIIFQRTHFHSPFYQRSYSKLWDALATEQLWTAVCLASCILLENNFYSGTLIIWMIGSPILIVYIYISRDEKVDVLLANINKFANGEEIIFQSRVLMTLLARYKIDKQMHIILDGYIEIHKQFCNKPDCSLVAKNNQKINRIIKQIKANNPEIDNEKHAKIIQVVYQMFYEGTKRFPNHTSLRINYSSFLIEKMKFKQTALQELNIAEENFPPFDIQFTIFRLKKIIEEEIQNENKQNKMKIGGNLDEELGVLDIISEIRYQDLFKQLRIDIEASSEAHMDFWQQLSEETPDMKKVHQFGRQIYRAKAKVENDWQRLTRICNKRPKALRFYASYEIEIIQDTKTGQQLHNQANFLLNNGKKHSNRTKGEQDIEQDTDSSPCIIISAESDKLGQIQHLNLAATILIGSNKTELINNNINKLMPNLYGQSHDQFLENYLNRNEFTFFKEERHLFITHKSQYIIPIYVRVKSLETLMHGLQLIGNIRYDKQYRNQAYILINVEGQINTITSTCLSILKIDHKIINQKEKKIENFFPKLMDERDNYMCKQGALYNYKQPGSGSFKDLDSAKTINIKITMSEICFSNDEFVGYIIKVDKVNEPTQGSRLRPQASISTFQFNYNRETKSIYGEYGFIPGSEADSQSHEQNLNNSIHSDNQSYFQNRAQSKSTAAKKHQNQSNIQQNKSNLSNNTILNQQIQASPIRMIPSNNTQQTVQSAGKKNNGVSFNQNQIDEEAEGEKSVGQDDYGDDNVENEEEQKQQVFTTEGNKHESNQPSYQNAYIKNTLYQQNQLKNDGQINTQYDKGIKTVRLFKNKISEMHEFKDDDSENSSKEEEDMDDSLFKSNIDDSADEGTKLNHNFNDTFASRKALNVVINSKIVPQGIRMLNGLVKIFLLSLTVICFVEYFIGISEFGQIKSDLQLITYSSQRISNFQYILANIRDIMLHNDKLKVLSTDDLNKLVADTKAIVNDTDTISSYLLLNTNNPSTKLKDLLENSALNVIIEGGSQQKYNLNQVTSQMISKALSIINSPLETILSTNQEVQNFYMNIFNDYQIYLRKSNNQYVSDLTSETTDQSWVFFTLLIFSPVLIFLFMCILYPVLNYVNKSSGQVINLFLAIPNKYIQQIHAQCQNFVSQLRADEDDTQSVNDLDREDENQGFDSNQQGEEEIMKRKKKKYVNQIDNNIVTIISKMSFGVLTLEAYFIATFFMGDNLLKDIETLLPEFNYTAYSESLYIFSDNSQRNLFINPTQQVLNNPCQFFVDNQVVTTVDECSKFANGAVQSGMTAAFTRYFENIRQLLTFYQQIKDNAFQWKNVDPRNTFVEIDINKDKTQNTILNLLRLPIADEIRDMQRKYIKVSIRQLVSEFQKSIRSRIEQIQTVKFILFLIFIAMIFLMYLVFWWPIADSLTEDIWITQSLLTTVPLQVLKIVRPIQVYIKILYDDQQREQSKKKQIGDELKGKDKNRQKVII